MSLPAALHTKLCPIAGQLFVRSSSRLAVQSSLRVRCLRYLHASKSNGSPFQGSLLLARHNLFATGSSRNISFLSPRSITDKLKPVIRKMKRYATGVLVVFVLIYTCISYSVSSVLYQLLKMQANSISIKDESLETKNEKSQ